MSTSTRATARKPKLRSQSLDVRRGRIARVALEQLARDLAAGSVAIFPTETVYGIGTSAFSRAGIRRIYQIKGRRWNKPLALLVPSLEASLPLVEEIPPEARRLAEKFWPGPLTLVLRASALGKLVTGGLDRIGLRVPRHALCLDLLRTAGVPLATTSVNRSGEPPATHSRALKSFARRVEWFLDGGACPLKEASSVVDLSHYPFTVIREGALGKAALLAALESGQ